MREGLVVASCGLYFPIVAKSPESQTTVVPVAFNCSRELVMISCFSLLFIGFLLFEKLVDMRYEWVSRVKRKVVEGLK